ncbi:MAG: outer membrane protein transport protein [Myxococcales bacterium]|nr:outer membrane protein transport protein [Myxococcales bacterium]
MNRPVAVVAALAALSASAQAGGFGIPEIGVRRTAMGSIIGRPDDGSAIYHNPAGLSMQPGWNIYVSMGLALISTEFQLAPWDRSDEFLGAMPEADGYYAPIKPSRAMGVIPMLAVTGEVLPGKLTMGAALYVGNAQGAAFRKEDVTRYHLIDGYVIAPQAVIAASYKINDQISVGGSVGMINMIVHGKRNVYPVINGTDFSSYAGTNPELVLDGEAWAPSWMLAAFGRPHDKITWGATITGRVDATLEGPVEITFSDDAQTPGDMLIGRHQTKQMIPWAFMAGAAFDVSPKVEIGTEARWWLYRQYKTQLTDVTGIAIVDKLETKKNYHDSWEVSGGVRVHDLDAAPGLDLMAGLQFDRSPAPPQTVTLDQPSFTHPAIHAGARFSTGRYRFGASWVHYIYLIDAVDDSTTTPPSNFKGSGRNNIFTLSIEARL